MVSACLRLVQTSCKNEESETGVVERDLDVYKE